MISQEAVSHRILNEKLKKSSFKKLIKSCKKADVIFFGEIHNDPISHWLQMKLLKTLNSGGDLVLALEMFEKDQQEVVDSYLSGKIEKEEFEKEARLWTNYETDYSPIVEFAKTEKIPVIASNIPRRYASMVYKSGFEAIETLVPEEKQYIAPLPIPYDASLPAYVKMLEMVEGHGGENFPKAQAIKDATMAHSIGNSIKENSYLVHVNGKFHSDNGEGILWYLEKYQPGLNVVSISVVKDPEVATKDLADFIIVVDSDMTVTYK